MIIKSMSRKTGSFGGLMSYMHKEQMLAKNQLEYQTRNEELEERSIKHLLKGHRTNDWIEQFEKNQEGRKFKRSDMVLFYHEIISFSPKDTELISDEMLDDISRRYIRIRSPYAPAVATIHHDVDHLHVHFCIAGCQYKTGLANRLSKSEFAQVKKEMQAYQQTKYPQLTNSIVEHGKGLEEAQKLEFQNGQRKLSKRALVKAQVEAVFAQSNDYNELLDSLQQAGMPSYIRGGRVYGVAVGGKKYRFKTLGFAERFEELAQEQNMLQELEAMHYTKSKELDLTTKVTIMEEPPIEYDKEILDIELEENELAEIESTESIKPKPILGELEEGFLVDEEPTVEDDKGIYVQWEAIEPIEAESTESIKSESILGELKDFFPMDEEPTIEQDKEIIDVEWQAIEPTEVEAIQSTEPSAEVPGPSLRGGGGIGGGVASIIGNIILGLTMAMLSRAPSSAQGGGDSYGNYNNFDQDSLEPDLLEDIPSEEAESKTSEPQKKIALESKQESQLAEIDAIRERSQKGRSLDELEMNNLITEFDQSIIDIEPEESDLDSDLEAGDFSPEE